MFIMPYHIRLCRGFDNDIFVDKQKLDVGIHLAEIT